ncbi:MAG TPA: hypothetical protein VFF68_12505, partial [Anaerolineaceae bacterium]|nr:hypothetical protein [Anaerolineaceae bacterium]
MTSLANRFFTVQTDPERGTFSVLPSGAGFPRVENARMLVHYRTFDRKTQAPVRAWSETDLQADAIAGIGPIRVLAAQTEADANGLSCRIEFALSDDCPLFFWRLSLVNNGELPVTVDRLELLRTGGQAQEGRLVFAGSSSDNLGFYANGWQSWSLSGAFGNRQALPHTRLGLLQSPMVDLPGTPALQQPGYFGSDLYGIVVDRGRRTALLAGFLSQREHFGSLEAVLFDRPSLRLWANGDGVLLEGGQAVQTDWAILFPFEIDRPDAITPYLDAVARHHGIRPTRSVPTGWCSWYYYYTKVTARAIDANMKQVVALSPRLPLDLIQIDDGFETHPGDWLS